MSFKLAKINWLLLFEKEISESLEVTTYVPTLFIVLIHVIGKFEFVPD